MGYVNLQVKRYLGTTACLPRILDRSNLELLGKVKTESSAEGEVNADLTTLLSVCRKFGVNRHEFDLILICFREY